jgi:hypothetical protein
MCDGVTIRRRLPFEAVIAKRAVHTSTTAGRVPSAAGQDLVDPGDADERRRIVEAAGPDARAIGIEVFFGAQEGLAEDGVVRVGLPLDGKIFCTWMLSLGGEYLIERIGVLSPAKQHELDVAMELSGAE